MSGKKRDTNNEIESSWRPIPILTCASTLGYTKRGKTIRCQNTAISRIKTRDRAYGLCENCFRKEVIEQDQFKLEITDMRGHLLYASPPITEEIVTKIFENVL